MRREDFTIETDAGGDRPTLIVTFTNTPRILRQRLESNGTDRDAADLDVAYRRTGPSSDGRGESDGVLGNEGSSDGRGESDGVLGNEGSSDGRGESDGVLGNEGSSDERSESDGVLGVTDRITGEFIFEAPASDGSIRRLVEAARSAGGEDPRYYLRIEPGDGDPTVAEKGTLLVYSADGNLNRKQSLIPGSVEI